MTAPKPPKVHALSDFLDALRAEIDRSLPAEYVVHLREPTESELQATETHKQVFVTVGALDFPVEHADLGESSEVQAPLFASLVMKVPTKGDEYEWIVAARHVLMQACMRAIRDHTIHGPGAGLIDVQMNAEQPEITEGHYLSHVNMLARYTLRAESENP